MSQSISISGQLSSTGEGTITNTPSPVVSSLSPIQSRTDSLKIPNLNNVFSTSFTVGGYPITDRRVRISLPINSPQLFYNDSTNKLLAPLYDTKGVLFPFQPKVDISFAANYQAQKVTQNNFTFYHYENSEMKPITITGDFPVRIPSEGAYVLAAMTFLRSLTMMFTGNDGQYAGAPPLVVRLFGMGFGGLDNIPVAITDVTTSYPDNVDYVTVPLPPNNSEIVKIPSLTTITITCNPMFSRQFSTNFSTQKFAGGQQRLLGPEYATSLVKNSYQSILETLPLLGTTPTVVGPNITGHKYGK